jgi:hypothetical protein
MEALTFVDIADFTPGIRHTISPGHPIGSATHLYTYGCHSDESKGLVPGPAPVRTWEIDPDDLPGTSSPASLVSEGYRIGGLFCNDPVFTPGDTETGPDQNNSEIYVGVEWWTNGVFHRAVMRLLRHRTNPTWDQVWDDHTSQTYDHLSRPKRCYFSSGRSNNADASQVGPIVVGWVYGGPAKFFPDDTDTDSGTVAGLAGDDQVLVSPDTFIGHQGRALIFPLSLGFMGQTDIISVTNENYYWSGVNDWRTLDSNLSGYFTVIAGYEDPTGYGVVASNDAGELLLIKARGGAFLIRGDLNNFAAQTLPNVRGTGQSLDLGCHTPIGYMYPVDASQVWIWLGGDSTTNAAPFLVNDFFRVHNADLDDTPTGWGSHFTQSASWGDLVMVGNNWFADTNILAPEGVPSWWRLDNQDTYRFCKWTVDWKGRHAYGAQMGFRTADDPVLVEYDSNVKVPYYSWQSHPLPFTISQDRASELRGTGTVLVTVSSSQNPEGKTQLFEFESSNTDDPQRRYATRQARAFSVKGTHLQVRIEARSLDGESSAPTICPPLSLGFRSAPHIPLKG